MDAFECFLRFACCSHVRHADIFVEKGFADVGFQYISIDDCWMKTSKESFEARNDFKKEQHEGFSFDGLVGEVRTAGGNVISTITASLDGSGNVVIDGNDPATWAQNAGGFSTARRAILYVARGGAASADELIAYSADFVADIGNVAADLIITLSASGILTSAR